MCISTSLRRHLASLSDRAPAGTRATSKRVVQQVLSRCVRQQEVIGIQDTIIFVYGSGALVSLRNGDVDTNQGRARANK